MTRTATVADVIETLRKNHLAEDESPERMEGYGLKIKLTQIGQDLIMTIGGPTADVLNRVLVPGLLVEEAETV